MSKYKNIFRKKLIRNQVCTKYCYIVTGGPSTGTDFYVKRYSVTAAGLSL